MFDLIRFECGKGHRFTVAGEAVVRVDMQKPQRGRPKKEIP